MRFTFLLVLLSVLGCKTAQSPADRRITLTPITPSPANPYLMSGSAVATNYLPGALPVLSTYNGAGITNIPVTTATGTLPTNTLPGQLSTLSTADGSGLTNLSGTAIASGTVSADRLASALTPASILYSATNLYDDLQFNISTLNPTGPLTGPTIVDTSGRDSQGEAAVFNTGDVLQWATQMPHTWVTNTTIYPHLHIEPQTTDAITNTWIVNYSVADIGEAFPAWTTVTNTVVIAASNQWKHQLIAVPTNGISMTGKSGPSTVVRFRASLTSNVDTHVLSADVHYRVRGSPVAYVAP